MDILSLHQPFEFGESHIPNGGSLGPLYRERLDLSISFAGKAVFSLDHKTHEVTTGMAMFMYNEHIFEADFPRGQERHCVWCHTCELIVPGKLKAQFRELPLFLPPSELLLTLLKEGAKLGHSDNTNTTRVRSSLGVAAFNEYFRLARLRDEESYYPRAVLKAKRYIEHYYLNPCDLSEIATQAAINPQYLTGLFKQHLGTTPIRYLWELRGARGVELLKQSGMSISEIAYSCGFRTPNHFSRYIREHYGLTPSAIREDHRAGSHC